VKCGVAEYCAYLLEALSGCGFQLEIFSNRRQQTMKPDDSCVHRPWEDTAETLPQLVRAILESGVNDVLVQYHHAFYPPQVLAALIEALASEQVGVFVIHHATFHEELCMTVPSLAKAAVNFVHSQADLERFAFLGLGNVRLLPHGIYAPPMSAEPEAHSPGEFVVGSFGFLMPHKGFLELISAAYLLKEHIPGLRLELYAAEYPNQSSERLLTRCREYIRYLGCADRVTLETDYMRIEEVITRLQRCHLVVFPYQHTRESSSASVRIGLASRRPVLCTPLEIFEDVRDTLHFIGGFDPFAIGAKILELYRNPELLRRLGEREDVYLETHSWKSVALIAAAEIEARRGRLMRLAARAAAI
jgi:glycosyltransferase involved in cell wall biosynthesis